MRPDLRLFALIDPEHTDGWDIVELARLAAEGERWSHSFAHLP